jgi:DNA-binding NarL/FixJ family response regulator
MSATIRVAVVDDDKQFRQTVEGLLNFSSSRFVLAGSFESAESALPALPPLQPDVVLMDVNLPKTSGVDCARKLSGLLPKTQIMMLTVSEDSERIFESLRVGATGYLVKRDVFEKLHDAILTLITTALWIYW